MLLALISGCASAPQAKRERFFWPVPPDTPRLEFLAAYWGSDDLPTTAGQKLLKSIAGTESRNLARPWGISSDGEGKVFVTDPEIVQVWVFDFNKGEMRAFGGEEAVGVFDNPMGIALDGDGNVYISDSKKNKVFVFTKDEKPLTAIGDSDTLKWPVGMAVDNKLKRLYVCNAQGHNIAVFDLSGKYLFSIGKRGTGEGELNFPVDLDLDSEGNLVVTDTMNSRVQILTPEGKFIRKFGQRGDGIMDFQAMKGIAVDKATDNIYVVDGRLSKVLIFNKDGEGLMRFGGEASPALLKALAPGGFSIPQDIMIDKRGQIYVSDSLNHRIQVFKIIDEQWLKENPIKKEEVARPPEEKEKDKKKGK